MLTEKSSVYSKRQRERLYLCHGPEGAKKRINAAKRSAVSTGPLSMLPHVHVRPIDLVVFQEPSP